MSHNTIAVLGHFGKDHDLLNGQTIKTKNLVEGLEKYGDVRVLIVDSYGWMKHPIKLVKQIEGAFINSNAVVMLPAHNGVRIFAPLLARYKRKYHKKIFYDVIGGWLPEFLESKRCLRSVLKRFDGIWIETATMKKKLDDMGFENTIVVPNFKELSPLNIDELVFPSGIPFRLCTFSRVMKEKGIGSAVQVIKEVNEQLGYIAYSLDIYGRIWNESKEWFENLQQEFPSYISYKGCVDADKSVETLQDYFALMFPTHFYTEGIPGTIIDAYAAGVPVISAKWESYLDVIDEGKTGIGYEFDSLKALEKLLLDVARNPKMLLDMKINCVKKAKEYITETAIRVMTENFGGGYNLYPLKLCTFSRVMKEKGIEDAVNAVIEINHYLGYTVFCLDIYGQIWDEYKERFDDIQKAFPEYVRYCGSIGTDESVDVLKVYFALLFPTYYEGEGFAGTLIDAYSAGVPVIATDWRYNSELVTDNTGFVYPTGNQKALLEILTHIAVNPSLVLAKKKYCIEEANKFRIDTAIQVLIRELERE